ncbi:transcriptional regulator, MerR family [Actinokineospora spheciospongiae]|uniref:Transcriptional regulator, MerR family n=1 Tax=Actinokineospora spheciospongiae TaxID=909613 RepID=W7IT51_9PSEU|nr:MerR family transcriptional regulator [Actinokineospora spheciospongiae]EWC59942.1 transcriptional regulator, MerR family [Actinokineospora spheciospongiae]
MAGAAARPERDGASIGAVLERLRPEFPDVTISKIRFLESEGLVSPERTPSGYRRFTEADVARLRFVLAAQRDQYLPLRVIREQLDNGRPPARAAEPEPVDPLPEGARLPRAEVLARAGVGDDLLSALEEYGLLTADRDGHYDGGAVSIARTAASLAAYGIEPRHLRAFRAAAEREVGLVEQVVAPLYRQRDPAARGRADEVARDLADLSVDLHALLVRAGLRRLTGT